MIQPFRLRAQSYSSLRGCRSSAPDKGKSGFLPAACLLLAILSSMASAQEADEDPDDVSTGAQYVDLQPEFVLNYGLDGRLRYLRMEVTLLLEDALAASDANHHAPALRHIVVMNVSKTARSELQTTAGRQTLRQRMLDDMQALLNNETGESMVRDVLFSNLILQ